jgi:hypothetical protein
MQNKGDPEKAVQQIMHSITPEQRQSILSQAKQFGVPEDILSKVQNMK